MIYVADRHPDGSKGPRVIALRTERDHIDDSLLNPWKYQPPCAVCHEQHAGYEQAHA